MEILYLFIHISSLTDLWLDYLLYIISILSLVETDFKALDTANL